MKKVLVMNNTLHGGGVERVLHDVVEQLENKGYKITVATLYKDKKFKELYSDKIHYCWISGNPGGNSNRIVRHIERIRFKISSLFYLIKFNLSFFDLVIAIKEGASMLFLSRIITCKNKVGWIHVDFEGMHWTKWIYRTPEQEFKCMMKYRKIICVSEKVRKSVCHIVGDTGNLVVRYNPIDKNRILKKAEEPVEDFEKKAHRILFVTIGRMHYQKGYDLLIEAVDRLKQYENQFEVLILGEGPELEKYRKIIKEKSIQNIYIPGSKENPYKYLKMADWFLSTSRYEGYSLVSQEAAVLGKPIIATNCSGVPELLGEKSEFGIVIDCSVEAICEGIQKVLQNRELQKYYQDKILHRQKIISYDERMKAIMEVLEHDEKNIS